MSDPVVCPRCKHEVRRDIGQNQCLHCHALMEARPSRGASCVLLALAFLCPVLAYLFPRIAEVTPALAIIEPAVVWSVLLPTAIVLAVSGGEGLYRLYSRPPADWETLTVGLGGELIEETERRDVRIAVGDWVVSLDKYSRLVSSHSSSVRSGGQWHTYTRMRVPYREVRTFRFDMGRTCGWAQPLLSRLFGGILQQAAAAKGYESGLGDRELDKRYLFGSTDRSLACEVFSEPRLRELLASQGSGWSLKAEPVPDEEPGVAVLTFEEDADINDLTRLARMRDLVMVVMDRLHALGLVSHQLGENQS